MFLWQLILYLLSSNGNGGGKKEGLLWGISEFEESQSIGIASRQVNFRPEWDGNAHKGNRREYHPNYWQDPREYYHRPSIDRTPNSFRWKDTRNGNVGPKLVYQQASPLPFPEMAEPFQRIDNVERMRRRRRDRVDHVNYANRADCANRVDHANRANYANSAERAFPSPPPPARRERPKGVRHSIPHRRIIKNYIIRPRHRPAANGLIGVPFMYRRISWRPINRPRESVKFAESAQVRLFLGEGQDEDRI